MLYLSFAILFSASIALIFKFSENRSYDRYVVTSANYLTASLVSLIIILQGDLELPFVSFGVGWRDLAALFPPGGDFSLARTSLAWGAAVGIPAGLFFFLSFIFYQKGINENGAGLAGAFAKIGILVPMSFSIVIWNEIPTAIQGVGIFLSVLSILLVNVSMENLGIDQLRPTLLVLFLFSGLAEFSNKVFQEYGMVDHKPVFLFFVFFTAFVISVLFLLWRGVKPSLPAVATGLVVGFPNLFCSYFLILALDQIKASVVFPAYTAATIVLISLGGYLIFGERLEVKERVSIGLTVAALVLINL